MCSLPDGSDGLCCKIKNGGKTGTVDPLIEDLAIRDENSLSIRDDVLSFNEFEIRQAAEIGQSFADNVTRSSRKTLKKANLSSFLHAQNQRQNPGIDALNKASLAFTEAARNLISDRGTTTDFEIRQLFSVEFDNSVLNGQCKGDDQFDCAIARRSKYRKIDGSCNNLRRPKVGIKLENQFQNMNICC